MGILPFALWLTAMVFVAGWAIQDGTRKRPHRMRLRSPVSQREPWEANPDAWKGDMSEQADGYTPPSDFVKCPKCKEVAAFIDNFDGLLACAVCRERFHPDFEQVVRNIPTSDKAA